MFNPDEFYQEIDRQLVGELKTTGKMENAFWQHLGKFANRKLPNQGSMYDEMISNIERMMKGLKKHGFEQNKKTEWEKLIDKGRKMNETRS